MPSQNWKGLMTIQAGSAVCLPLVLVGYESAQQFQGAPILALFIGNTILFVLALGFSLLSLNKRMATAQHAESVLGQRGKQLFGLALTFSMCGWFAIQTQAVSLALWELSPLLQAIFKSELLLRAILAILMLGIAFFGVQGLARLADYCIPLMAVTLFLLLWLKSESPLAETNGSLEDFSLELPSYAISLAIGAMLAAVVDLPTFFRFAASKKDAFIASAITFLIVAPLVETIGVLLYIWDNSESFSQAVSVSSHPLWMGWWMLFLFIAAWTTNGVNLYSAGSNLQVVFSGMNEKRALTLAGLAALLLSLSNLVDNLELTLNLLGMCLGCFGGAIFSSYCLTLLQRYPLYPSLGTAIAALISFSTMIAHISLTTIPLLDALLLAFLLNISFSAAADKKAKLILETT